MNDINLKIIALTWHKKVILDQYAQQEICLLMAIEVSQKVEKNAANSFAARFSGILKAHNCQRRNWLRHFFKCRKSITAKKKKKFINFLRQNFLRHLILCCYYFLSPKKKNDKRILNKAQALLILLKRKILSNLPTDIRKFYLNNKI